MMLKVNGNTKISVLLKEHPDALESIISLSPGFSKLRNPILRKILAPRTTIAMAGKIGNCRVEDFLNKLAELGFDVEHNKSEDSNHEESSQIDIDKLFSMENILELDVRPILNSGHDPLKQVLKLLQTMKESQALKLISDFKPEPLIRLLSGKGYKVHHEEVDIHTRYTFFYKTNQMAKVVGIEHSSRTVWNEKVIEFTDRMEFLDVRSLEMPKPMLAILEKLAVLSADKALMVYHKRIPVLLLEELNERNFEYCILEKGQDDVRLLICQKQN